MRQISWILLIFISKVLMAQEVNSKTYDILLSTLLSHSVEEISVKDAAENTEALFIDAREKQEFEVSRIENSVWVGYDELDLSSLDKVSRDKEVIVYCSVGYRSEKVSEKLKEKGFINVKNLYGGIFEWVNQGEKVVDAYGKATSKVHAYNKLWGVWLDKGEKVY